MAKHDGTISVCSSCGKLRWYHLPSTTTPEVGAFIMDVLHKHLDFCQCKGSQPQTRNPERTTHDGHLDSYRDVTVSYVGGKGITIESDLSWTDDRINLRPKHALSLLAWLEQERETLERFAKEVEHVKAEPQ